ncbi:MAG: DUF2087 domain-containing protein [Clostridia bacterium]|nr:DUF2087 domain-containing protein [Clostridia bacterium]
MTDEEREKVKAFFKDGRLIKSPAKLAKRHICYRIILERFEFNRQYPEQEVNAVIEEVYDDYCEVRRHFVDFGWMERDSGVYRRV